MDIGFVDFKYFVENEVEWEALRCWLKLQACPHCGRRGNLNRHGMVYRYTGAQAIQRETQGYRLLCSNRHRRKGCGRTVSVRFSQTLERSLLKTPEVSVFLAGLLRGQNPHLAYASIQGCSSSGAPYRLCTKLERAQLRLRSILSCRYPKIPQNSVSWSWLHPYDHLTGAAQGSCDPLAWFQYKFQTSLFAP